MSDVRTNVIYDAISEIHRRLPLGHGSAETFANVQKDRLTAINEQFPDPDDNSLARFFDQQLLRRESIEVPIDKKAQVSSNNVRGDKHPVYETWYTVQSDQKLGDLVTFIEPIDRGATSELWRVESKYGAHLAIKILNAEAFTEKERETLAIAELQNTFRKNHDNVVHVYNALKIRSPSGQEVPIILMEYIDGQNLKVWFQQQEQPLAADDTYVTRMAAIVSKLADALHHLHTRGNVNGDPIFHQDVKPENIMIGKGVLKWVDFGAPAPSPSFGQIGNRRYMAPERTAKDAAPTAGWDIFGVGGILYYLCSGAEPPSAIDSGRDQWNQFLRSIDLGSVDLTLICRTCLAYDSEDRYKSADSVVEDLSAWADVKPLRHARANSYSRIERQSYFIRRLWERDFAADHLKLLSIVSIVIALVLAVEGIAYGALVMRGVEPNDATGVVAIPTNASVALLALLAGVIVKGRLTGIRYFLPVLAFVFCITTIWLGINSTVVFNPTHEETTSTLFNIIPIVGLFLVTLGHSLLKASTVSVVGWSILVASPFVRTLDQSDSIRNHFLLIVICIQIIGSLAVSLYCKRLAADLSQD